MLIRDVLIPGKMMQSRSGRRVAVSARCSYCVRAFMPSSAPGASRRFVIGIWELITWSVQPESQIMIAGSAVSASWALSAMSLSSAVVSLSRCKICRVKAAAPMAAPELGKMVAVRTDVPSVTTYTHVIINKVVATARFMLCRATAWSFFLNGCISFTFCFDLLRIARFTLFISLWSFLILRVG